MAEVRAIILGCGSSGGVPRIGNDWGACDPENPKNRRSRCGMYLEIRDGDVQQNLLIDTAPDLREQLLRHEINRVDGVLYTHTHADQCHGIDDLRVLAYMQRKRMPIFASEQTFNELHERFGYCFKTPDGSSYPPILDARPAIRAGEMFSVGPDNVHSAFSVLPVDQDHGSVRSLGFRIGDFAYCNDVVDLPEESLALLKSLDVFVVDALRYEPHPTHAHVEKALSWIAELKPRKAILTNLHIDLDYETLSSELPENVYAAYDGLSITSNFP